MPRFHLLLLAAPWLAAAACGSRADLEADRAELLRLHQQQRHAHFEKRADLLVGMLADDFMMVADGEVERPAREDNQRRMQAYFDRSTFLEWDDVEPPAIRISPDGQMAWVVVLKRVRLTAPDSLGVATEDRATFAWMETWEKEAGRWILKAVASTDR